MRVRALREAAFSDPVKHVNALTSPSNQCLLARQRSQRGFTLLEVIVAFTIFAVTFTAVIQILSTSSRNEEIAANYGLAVSQAESLLALTGVETPLTAGEWSGELGQGMRWDLSVDRYGAVVSPEAARVAPYSIKVTVSWGEGPRSRSVTLSTLRLGAPG